MRKEVKTMQNIEQIAKLIQQNGGKLYLVGGAIRDEIMEITPTDKDYCVTGLRKEKFQNIFPEAKIQGKDFPVFILNGQEFALARKERKAGLGHKAFDFLADETITIEEDLARRDITVNSMAQDVLTKKIIDPFGGIQDIQNKIIRKTTNAFKEDPLRVYRVARFAATLQFTVELETLKTMGQLKEELTSLSKERVFAEFQKALASNQPSYFFDTLRKANLLEVHFEEIANLIGKTQPEKYHPEGDSYNHTMIVVDKSTRLTKSLPIRFSCLAHDFGKGQTPKEILPHHYGHDEKGIELVVKLANRIGLPNEWKKCGKTACQWHMKAGIFEQMTSSKQVELIEQVSKTMLGLEGLQIVVACDKNRQGEDLEKTFSSITFTKLGEKCLEQITGETIKKEYPNLIGEKLGEKLHEERVKWIKSIDKN